MLPYIDTQVIHDNPNAFMGYSDIATWMAVFAYAGVRAYYGPNLLTPIAQPIGLDKYTEESMRQILFTSEIIGEIKPCSEFTSIEWKSISNPGEIKWTPNNGYHIL